MLLTFAFWIITKIMYIKYITLAIEITPCWIWYWQTMPIFTLSLFNEIFSSCHLLGKNLWSVSTTKSTFSFSHSNEFGCFRLSFLVFDYINSRLMSTTDTKFFFWFHLITKNLKIQEQHLLQSFFSFWV